MPQAPKVVAVSYNQGAGSKELIESLIAVRRGQTLSLRMVRRSIERLFATGKFADVVVTATDAPGGVALLFEITPKRYIAKASVEGAKLFTESEVLQAANLAKGVEYYPERVGEAEQAVGNLYHRHGYDQARVTVDVSEGDEGLEAKVRVVEGPPTRVASISIAGGPGLPLPRLLDALGERLGDVLDLDKLDKGLEKLVGLFRAERFYRAQIGEPVIERGRGGGALLIPVAAGAQYGFGFHGNRSFPDRYLQGVVSYDGTEPLDRPLLNRLARKLATFYRYRGFYDVQVSAHENYRPDYRQAALIFEIDEGRPLYVREIAFEGNRAIDSEALQAILKERIQAKTPVPSGDVHPTDDPVDLEGRPAEPGALSEAAPEPLTIYVDDAYLDAAQTMEQAYHDRGYLSAQVTVSEVRIDERRSTARVHFHVDEGPRTIIQEVEVAGAPPGVNVSTAVETGDPMTSDALDRAKAALGRALGHGGYLFAHVDADAQIVANGTSAHLLFRIDPGPRVRVGQVIVQGLSKVPERAVRATLQIHEGDLLDPEDLFESQRKLVLLGFFRQVAVRLIAPDTAEPIKDVVVEVKELPTATYEVSGGYTLVDGPVLVLDGTVPNVGGSETNLSATLKLSYFTWSLLATQLVAEHQLDPATISGISGVGYLANVTLQHPSFQLFPGTPLSTSVTTRGDLVAERVFRPSYQFQRIAALGSLELKLESLKWFTLASQVEPEFVLVRTGGGIEQILPTLTPADQARLRFPVGNFTLLNLRATPTADFRDDAANPHHGLLISVPLEYTHAITDTLTDSSGNPIPNGFVPITTLKTSVNVTGYLALTPKLVLALSARGGRIWKINPNSQTIAPKRFFLGGSATMRGFTEDGLMPQDKRQDLFSEVGACRALVNAIGCTPGAQVLLAGNQLASTGGEAYDLGKAELRFPVGVSLEMGVFIEAGNLWLDQSKFNLGVLRWDAGAGFRYPTPIGPLALDWGFNLDPDPVLNEPIGNLNFSVGLF